MGQVVSFEDFVPAARFDAVPWTNAQIYETDDPETGTWTLIDTIALTPDADPSQPAARSFTTENGTGPNLWYRIVFTDASADVTEPTAPIQNIPTAVSAYATVDELARILKIRQPSAAQTAAMKRVLFVAAGEIDNEIDLPVGTALQEWQRLLCAQVNLDRAADLWRHTESAPGILGIPDETVVSPQPMRYAWTRYAQRLAPLKKQWGLA